MSEGKSTEESWLCYHIVRMSIISKGLWWIGLIWVFKAWCVCVLIRVSLSLLSRMGAKQQMKESIWKVGGSREKIHTVACGGEVAAVMLQTRVLISRGLSGTWRNDGQLVAVPLQRWSQSEWPEPRPNLVKAHMVSWPWGSSEVSPQTMACVLFLWAPLFPPYCTLSL